MGNEIQKGSLIELEIENSAFGGRGVARRDGMVVFVDGGLPGDRVRARITKRKPQYAEARVEEVTAPSPHRTQPRCPLFGTCGGCRWQDFAYDQQLAHKQEHVADALRHIARQHDFELRPIIASPDVWGYRNKMEFSFGRSPEGAIDIGFHLPGDFRKIIDVERCFIQPDTLTEALGWFRRRLNAAAPDLGARFAAYDQRTHSGFLRHLVFRFSHTTGEFLAALLTADGAWRGIEELAEAFLAEFPQCQGFTWGINRGLSDVARMDEPRLQAGRGWIEETLGSKTFRISTFSFFQTNTRGAKLLYDVVRDFAELTGRETVLDAYCGTGTIGIYLADLAREVVGIELVTEAVWDARHNAQRNGAGNCTFLAGEMREVLKILPSTMNVRFDRIVVDPPRGGMDKKSLRYLMEICAPLLVYVSCNPTTLARDAVTLEEAGYVIEAVQPVDMFPHTYHVESVIRFRRAGDRTQPEGQLSGGLTQ